MRNINEMNDITKKVNELLFTSNTNGSLDEILEKLGLLNNGDDESNPCCTVNPAGKTLIIGESAVKRNNIVGMLKDPEFGFTNSSIMKRFDFVFEYETLNSFPINKISKWSYAVILAGPMPHSIKGRGENSSLLTMLEKNEDGYYPPVVRLTANEQLKITKQNVHDTLLDLMKKGAIAA